jgi:hypothetical protein
MSALVTKRISNLRIRVHTISDTRWMTQQAGHGEIEERRSSLAHKQPWTMAWLWLRTSQVYVWLLFDVCSGVDDANEIGLESC